jgi:4-alpha-glucanotransferase
MSSLHGYPANRGGILGREPASYSQQAFTSAHQTSQPMRLPRAAGILLHPTSLPGPNGIGEFGPEALHFLDLLAEAGITLWQMLPLGPTGYGDSPYQCFSSFAGNSLLIRVPGDVEGFPADRVDFPRVIASKRALLRRATRDFEPDEQYRAFVAEQSAWLEDYALFMALKDAHGGIAWPDWESGAALRDPAALERWSSQLAGEVEHYRREQALFSAQFRGLKAACGERGIRLMGDVPIYVAHDSADVWANRGQFRLDAGGRLLVQAGVPPDYFSATGQLWGNPIYDWAVMRQTGYEWWIRRMRSAFELFDLIRLDHFRGFEAYWEVPAGESTAVHGRWVPGPGADLFEAITRALGPLPIVAENLGVITPEVEALRARLGYPGMSILQFAFGADQRANTFLPHSYPFELVVYTGTHDNDTTAGWWQSTGGAGSTRSDEQVAREKDFALRYLATDGSEMHWTLIRAALASVADTAIIPLQDVLGLGSEARMNLPGRQSGNWAFRFSFEQLEPGLVSRLRELVELYGRSEREPETGAG